MPCGIDDSDLEALRADDASFYGQDSAVSDTDTSDSDHETARAAKRVDRAVEENDEVFSDVDFPINTGTGAAAHPELAAVLDKIQALRTTGCGCAMNDYLCATFVIRFMKHYCDGKEDTLRLLKAGIPVVEVAEAEKPRLLQRMGSLLTACTT